MLYSKLSEAAVRKFSSKYVLFKISRYRKTTDKYNKTLDKILRKAPVKKSFIHKTEVCRTLLQVFLLEFYERFYNKHFVQRQSVVAFDKLLTISKEKHSWEQLYMEKLS